MKLENAHVLLTGGSKGIGVAVAQELKRQKARLTIVARPSKELDAIVAELAATAITCDLTDYSQVDNLIERAEAINGPLDVLINNAALTWNMSITEASSKKLRDQLTANLLSPMELMRQALPGMIKRRHGSIVNVSSLAAVVPQPIIPGYSPAKAGLAKASYDLQREMDKHGISIDLVFLGLISGTESAEEVWKQNKVVEHMVKQFADAPKITTQDVAAEIVNTLLSDKRMNIITLPKSAKLLTWLHRLPIRMMDKTFKKAFEMA